ncbi:MAG: FAD-dependent monooxygenase [Methylacidiphilales bacterium]|nr:FAD-dependent monooxygenase [Candidatus Methylacidiphilales bacterium]
MPITDFSFTTYESTVHEDLDNQTTRTVPVIIVGAGPSGLTLALELAAQQIPSVIIDKDSTVSFGSRAICYSKRTLEILGRLGIGKKLLAKGVRWNDGSVFLQNSLIYKYRLVNEKDFQMPAFINLQQYYLEDYLVQAVLMQPLISLRFEESVSNLVAHRSGSIVTVTSQKGTYQLACQYLIAADGTNSTIRSMMNLHPVGESFEDYFLICDVKTSTTYTNERIYWFNPSFYPQGSVLRHQQPDKVIRIDFQLGPHCNPEVENQPAQVAKYLNAMLGENGWSLEWSSIYKFRCRRLSSFVHNNVIFLGDSAHQVSPFGARGANGAIAAAQNLGWKLARVLKKIAPKKLLQSYDEERGYASDINILNSTRSALFISPLNQTCQTIRDSVLSLAKNHSAVQPLVNSGRLSEHCDYPASTLSDQQDGCWLMQDAPLTHQGKNKWLHNVLSNKFTLLSYLLPHNKTIETYCQNHGDLNYLVIGKNANQYLDRKKLLPNRLRLQEPCLLLIRPDQYRCASFKSFNPSQVSRAYNRAIGRLS